MGLTHLGLESSGITDDGLAALVRRCPLLRVLDICGCQRLSPAAYALLERCEHLEALHLGSRTITGESLELVAASPPLKDRVVSLNLEWNNALRGLRSFLSSSPAALHSIDVDYSHLDPSQFLALLPRCPRLERVTCDGFERPPALAAYSDKRLAFRRRRICEQ